MTQRRGPDWLVITVVSLFSVALLLLVPINPRILNPAFWQINSALGQLPLAMFHKTDATLALCPLVSQQTISQVADHRPGPSGTGDRWVFYEPMGIMQACGSDGIRYASFRFEIASAQCSAEAGIAPICDL